MSKILVWNNTPIIYNTLPLQYEAPIVGFLTFETDAFGPKCSKNTDNF